jgi:hypothetical protein
MVEEETFHKFLDDRNLLQAYKMYKDAIIDDTCLDVEFLECSFTWEDTSQGYEFWEDINEEWRHFLHVIKGADFESN